MYKVIMKYPSGETEELDEVFDTESEANEYGLDQCNNFATGGEIMLLSEGIEDDYDEEADFEVIEV